MLIFIMASQDFDWPAVGELQGILCQVDQHLLQANLVAIELRR